MIDKKDAFKAEEPPIESAKVVYPEHVAQELARIGEQLLAPNPNQHAGLYAAQQALCWAAQPEAYASPFEIIQGNAEERGYCSAQESRLPSSGIADRSD